MESYILLSILLRFFRKQNLQFNDDYDSKGGEITQTYSGNTIQEINNSVQDAK